MLWKNPFAYKPSGKAEQLPPLDKGDLPALLIAALVTLLPAVLVVGGLFTLVLWLLFLR